MLEEYSPYASMYNNPITIVDPFGNFGSRFGAWLHKVFNGGGKIAQNEYGEWYVNKTRGEITNDGGIAVVGYRYYGKNRNQYSAAGESLARDYAIMADIEMNGEKSMYQMYDSPQEAGNASLTIGTGVLLPNPLLKNGTIAANAGSNTSKVLSRGERLAMFKDKLLKAPMPKSPKEALQLINKTLDKIEKTHAGANDRMFGILDNKYVTFNSNGTVTALTKGHRIEIQSNGSFSIFERSSGNLFLSK